MPGPQITDPELAGTLFVPSTAQFSDFRRRHEAMEFVGVVRARRTCCCGCAGRRPTSRTGAARAATAPATRRRSQPVPWGRRHYRDDLRGLLCSITSFIDHANGIRIWECIDEGRTIDRLDVGHLPSAD